MKITQELAELLSFELGIGESEKGYTLILQGDFIADHKCEIQEVIFEFEKKFYRLWVSRMGSDFTYWEYDYELECPEVEKKIIQVESWEDINES